MHGLLLDPLTDAVLERSLLDEIHVGAEQVLEQMLEADDIDER